MSARAAWLAASSVAAAIVVAAGAFALAAPRPDPADGYRAYLDPDGALAVVTADPAPPGGPLTVSEARSGLARALSGIPAPAAAAAIATAVEDAGGTEILRAVSSGVTGDGTVFSSYSAYVLAPAALQLIAERVGGTDLWYDPPMTVLPGTVEVGTTWSEEGTVSGVATYTMEGRVEEADAPDCVRTVTRAVILLDDEVVRSLGQDTQWCVGRGSVSAIDLDSDLRVEVLDPPTAAPPMDAAGPTAALAEAGDLPMVAVAIRHAPRVAGGGVLLANSTSGDVVLAQPPVVEGIVPVSWLQHPGGDILGMAADDGGPIVGTTRREVVALDRAGRWRWTAVLGEAVAGDPVIVDDVVIIALLDGTVLGVDRDTGLEAWRARMSDAVRVAPIRVGDRVVVADITGEVASFSGFTGEREWAADTGSVLVPLTATPDGSVVVADRDGLLTLVDQTGRVRWSVPQEDAAAAAGAVAGPVLALPTSEGVRGYRLADGELAWMIPTSGPVTVSPTPKGDSVLVTSTGSARLVGADGTVQAQTTVVELDGSPAEGIQVVWWGGQPTAVSAGGSFIPLDSLMVAP